MRIAIAQTNIYLEDKSYNLKKAAIFISDAANNDADLIIFPEMSFTGFSMNIMKNGEEKEETIAIMKKLAVQYNISILFGWVEKQEGYGKNHGTIVMKDGTVCLDYIKIHPFSYAMEDKHYIAGDHIEIVKLNEMNISTFICYDLRFPEIFQAVSKQADIIIVIANWPQARENHWNCLLQARAIENQSYLIGVNCVGNQNTILYSGNSCMIDPEGKILISNRGEETLLIYDIENNVQKYRQGFPIKKDRKIELYRRIL
jgi:predicted amidohydrolase